MKGKCVLVVDDDELICWALERELSALGMQVDGVDLGAEALVRIRETSYELAFLDIELPDVNGLDLLPRIHGLTPETKVIILSAAATPENKRIAFAKGAWQFVDKPFEIRDVIGVVRSAIRKRENRRQQDRYLCRLPLRVSVMTQDAGRPGLELRNLSGTTLDVGPGGLRLRTDYPLRIGQRVRASLTAHDDPCARFLPSEVRAEVVWTKAANGAVTAGLRYLSPEDRATPARTS